MNIISNTVIILIQFTVESIIELIDCSNSLVYVACAKLENVKQNCITSMVIGKITQVII